MNKNRKMDIEFQDIKYMKDFKEYDELRDISSNCKN